MTCIVGIIDKETNSVVMGADSAGVAGLHIVVRKDPKMFWNGDFLIGCTSSFRMIQLLQYNLELPKYNEGDDLHKYMCTKFIDEVRKCFKKGGFLKKEHEEEEGGTFLVAHKNRLFTIEDDFQVAESEDPYAAVGCGYSYALGALSTLEEVIQHESVKYRAEVKVHMALEAASKHSGGVCEPFIIDKT